MAATNINRVVLTGNLTRDPELRSTGERHVGVLAADRLQHAPQGQPTGEWEDKPNYFDVTVWGAQGENCARFLAKGRPVAIDGRLEWREWEDKEGNKRQAVEIIADSVQFLGGRDDAGGGGGGNGFTPRSDVPVDTRDFQPAGAPRRSAPAAPTTTSRSRAVPRPSAAPPPRRAPRSQVRYPVATGRAPARARGARSRLQRAKRGFRTWRSSAAGRRAGVTEGRARRRPPQVVPVLQRQGRVGRLQGRRDAAQVHLRARQDPLAPHHRRVPRHQNQIATAVKRARELALLPYVAEPARATSASARPRPRSRPRPLARCPRRSCSRTWRSSASAATSSTSRRATCATS